MKSLRVDPTCHRPLGSPSDLLASFECLAGRHERPDRTFVHELHRRVEIVTDDTRSEFLHEFFLRHVVLSFDPGMKTVNSPPGVNGQLVVDLVVALLEDFGQPVELELVLKTWVVHLAVSLAAIG